MPKTTFIIRLLIAASCLLIGACQKESRSDQVISRLSQISSVSDFEYSIKDSDIREVISNGDIEIMLDVVADDAVDFRTRLAAVMFIIKADEIDPQGRTVVVTKEFILEYDRSKSMDSMRLLMFAVDNSRHTNDGEMVSIMRSLAFDAGNRDPLIYFTAAEAWLDNQEPDLSTFVTHASQSPRDRRLRAYVEYAQVNFGYIEHDLDGWESKFMTWLQEQNIDSQKK